MKRLLSFFFIICIVLQPSAFAAGGEWEAYFSKAGHTFSRGVQNALTFYMEIPITIQEYHDSDEGRAGFRHIAGFADGAMRAFHRAGSVVFDLTWAFIPEHQDGSNITPETLF